MQNRKVIMRVSFSKRILLLFRLNDNRTVTLAVLHLIWRNRDMKIKHDAVLFGILFISAFLLGCSPHEDINTPDSTILASTAEQYDPFAMSNSDSQQTDDIRFSWGFSQPIEHIPYAAEMPLDLFVENCSVQSADFGIMLFVDGILQYTDGQADSSICCHAHLNGEERKDYHLVLRPVMDAGLSKHIMHLGLIYGPNFQPQTPQTVYGHHHRITGIDVPFSDVSKQSRTQNAFPQIKSHPLTAEEKNNDRYQMSETSAMLLLEKQKTDNDPTPNSFSQQNKVTAVMLGGSTNGRWRISMFCSNQQVPAFNGQYYLDADIGAGEIAKYECDLSSLILKGCHSVYLVAVPLETQNTPLLQSHVMTFMGGET